METLADKYGKSSYRVFYFIKILKYTDLKKTIMVRTHKTLYSFQKHIVTDHCGTDAINYIIKCIQINCISLPNKLTFKSNKTAIVVRFDKRIIRINTETKMTTQTFTTTQTILFRFQLFMFWTVLFLWPPWTWCLFHSVD